MTVHSETPRADPERTTDDRRAPEHEVTRKNDEVPENRRDDRPHRDRDVERPRRERRGS